MVSYSNLVVTPCADEIRWKNPEEFQEIVLGG